MKRLLPVILAVLGLAAGTGAGIFLKPIPVVKEKKVAVIAPSKATTPEGKKTDPAKTGTPKKIPLRRSKENSPPAANQGYEYVKLNNQFIVPVINGSKVAALVVMSLSIEVTAGNNAVVYKVEPKLRDAFLQVLFNHANSGGFDGAFTSGQKMDDLRGSLFQAAVRILGPIATDVLVIDIVRQDI